MRVPRHSRAFRQRCLGALLAVGLAPGAAWAEPAEIRAPYFARPGFYIGVGASFGFPIDWNDTVSSFESAMTEDANANAKMNAEDVVPRVVEIEPVTVNTQGIDFDQTRFGAGGLIGYRLGRYLALELEGDGFADSSSTAFSIVGTDATGTAKNEELWMVTGNVCVYPTTGRFQPFAILGFGVIHARLDGDSAELTTPAKLSNGETIDLPAPFATSTDRLERIRPVGRFGMGLDGYLTERVVLRVKADYAIPLVDGALAPGDLVSLWVGLLYRF